MNKLAKINNLTSSCYLLGKNNTYKKLYCKLKNIDTVIMNDENMFFSYNNIYNGNKYLRNIIIDLKSQKNHVYIDADGIMSIENISFLNYPKLEGITIPMEILNKDFSFNIFISLNNVNIRKINLIYNEKKEEINFDETISWYNIKKISSENKLEIKIGYKNNDHKTIIYDSLGNKNITYENYNIEDIKDNNLDLREYNNVDKINYNNTNVLDSFIITPELLKKDLNNFKDIITDKLIILDDNEMLLNPIKLELDNSKINIISRGKTFGNNFNNVAYIENQKDGNKTYVYLDEDNKLNIIKEENLKANNLIDKYKFIKKDDNVGVIIKYKKDLKFDFIINNKLFHINKMFINWHLNNKSLYDSRIIPSYYSHKQNIFDIYKEDFKELSNYIFDKSLDVIIEHSLFDNFNREYNTYKLYLNYIKALHNIGYSYKALVYLHKNSFNNITGIKGDYRNIEDQELIDGFNNVSKKLVKRKD